ncbi:hypothetical protein ATL39_3200 [Sinobaca qinghaiensis]|uniref:Uncharacterized protein n=1 Tax=Sinobaca qinghaiensis TaxID=342944 RepID=A0A419UXA6_9BACL|nr:hypothetical protein [Sinobaca qinghaiensis]RKD69773.1 hypothetical protein ATL39_3200 [Sinobaca qinghaiensis]
MQYIFEIERITEKQPKDELQTRIAFVKAEVIHASEGTILYEMTIPVEYHYYGVYPDIKAIGKVVEDRKIKREAFFKLRRYIKKLRPFLELTEED